MTVLYYIPIVILGSAIALLIGNAILIGFTYLFNIGGYRDMTNGKR